LKQKTFVQEYPSKAQEILYPKYEEPEEKYPQHFRKKRKEQGPKTTNVEGCLFVERSEDENPSIKVN
jgi:hypothetical protein